jgi:hypothetical protein
MPSTAAVATPAVTPVTSAPTPIATIDSPSAMITINPWRSAKCSGISRQPLESITSGPPTSSTSAVAHSAPCSPPSANDAAVSRPTPIAVEIARPMAECRRPGSSRPAITSRATCMPRTRP